MRQLKEAKVKLRTLIFLQDDLTRAARPWGLFRWRSVEERLDYSFRKASLKARSLAEDYFRCHYLNGGTLARRRGLYLTLVYGVGNHLVICQIREDGGLDHRIERF